jgi:hypothetical protein
MYLQTNWAMRVKNTEYLETNFLLLVNVKNQVLTNLFLFLLRIAAHSSVWLRKSKIFKR